MKLKRTTNSIDAIESDYLYTAQSQLLNAGNGLYTAIPIYKDETIAVFYGEILSAQEAICREQKKEDQYFINTLNGMTMDSMHTTCFAKFANDVKGSKTSTWKNNSEISLDENMDICLVAKRMIHAGEEIFCGYGNRYWQKHGNVKPL